MCQMRKRLPRLPFLPVAPGMPCNQFPWLLSYLLALQMIILDAITQRAEASWAPGRYVTHDYSLRLAWLSYLLAGPLLYLTTQHVEG